MLDQADAQRRRAGDMGPVVLAVLADVRQGSVDPLVEQVLEGDRVRSQHALKTSRNVPPPAPDTDGRSGPGERCPLGEV